MAKPQMSFECAEYLISRMDGTLKQTELGYRAELPGNRMEFDYSLTGLIEKLLIKLQVYWEEEI